MMVAAALNILPHRGRGTARSAVEGSLHEGLRKWPAPSTILRMVPLPVPGRIS